MNNKITGSIGVKNIASGVENRPVQLSSFMSFDVVELSYVVFSIFQICLCVFPDVFFSGEEFTVGD